MNIKISKKKLIGLIIIFYIILYIILKLIIVYYQDLYMDNTIFDRKYQKEKILNVKSYSEEQRMRTDYFSSKSTNYKIKIKNYFNNFEIGDTDSNYEYHILYNENDNENSPAIMLGQFDSQISNTTNNTVDSIYYEFNYFPLYISHYLRNYFLKKNNIQNDKDLIKYLRKREKKECTFTTPIINIKEEFFFNFIETSYPSLENITYIEGDLDGYINEFDNYKQACIIKDNKLYCITFFNLDYFTNDIIKDILNSLIIEK